MVGGASAVVAGEQKSTLGKYVVAPLISGAVAAGGVAFMRQQRAIEPVIEVPGYGRVSAPVGVGVAAAAGSIVGHATEMGAQSLLDNVTFLPPEVTRVVSGSLPTVIAAGSTYAVLKFTGGGNPAVFNQYGDLGILVAGGVGHLVGDKISSLVLNGGGEF
jgi:hypothetical protein